MTTLIADRPFIGHVLTGSTASDAATEKSQQAARAALFQLTGGDDAGVGQKARLTQLARPQTSAAEIAREQAAAILDRILALIDGSAAGGKGESGPLASMDLAMLEKMPMSSMFMASSLLAGQVLGNVAEKKGEMLDIFSDKQDLLRREEVKNIREQMENAIEQQDKAKKAGIIGVVCDWVIAAVEVVTGVAKLIGGVMSGNVMQAAGGAMDLMAGLAGIGKAICNTMALVDPDNAEKYHAMAEKFGIAQMTFEIAGAAIDITSALRNAIVTKIIPTAAKTALKEGWGDALNLAVKEGSQSAVKEVAKQVGKEVAGQVAEQITVQLTKTTVTAASKKATSKILEAFSQQAIETMVTKSIQQVAKKAIKEGAELTTEELIKKAVAQIQKDVLHAVLKSSGTITSTVLHTTQGVVGGGQQIAIGSLEVQKAKLQRDMAQLMLDQEWLTNLFQSFEEKKKETVKNVRELQEDRGAIMQDATQIMSQTAACQAQMASSMV
ncbi:type III secretion system translocon subunit SctE [Aeromonas salmonicida]|uniref:type III secretion system translocon subunit SctE n=1 Tax=Aeromonas salmonicida TaxID=645 RepID=UPI00259FC459|nr:type III secretion system translocon subunit SctE [Aeromonas salmonicida]MDM5065375.1 type III secretion system translocon subunit SctE [Aeromonas salmonicida]